MLTGHEAVAIVQATFYVPLIPFTIYVFVKNWPIKPRIFRITWLTLAILSLMRFTGGILVIVRKFDPQNFGLTIATVVLLNVGLIPLIMSTFGMISIVLSSSNEKHPWILKTMILIRIIFVTALSHLLIGAGLSLAGHPIGDRFVQASYIAFAVVLSLVMGIIMGLHSEKKSLLPTTLMYLKAATITIPFLILRIIYAILSAFLDPATWSPFEGSPVAFALIALLPEYVVVCIYAYVGLSRAQKYTKHSREDIGDNDQLPSYVLAKGVATS